MTNSEKELRLLEEDRFRSTDADLQEEHVLTGNRKSCPFAPSTTEASTQAECPFSFIPLKLAGRTHKPSIGSQLLMKHEISLTDLQKMTDKFYEFAFKDATLDQFIRSHSDPHGGRFAKWIHQKLSGSTIWDEDRWSRGRSAPVHDRTSAHVAAWYSPKRPSADRGRHFQLDECRVWMRLHFWAMRESGVLAKSPSFADYYVRFIGHFVAVYESTAPMFARESFRWSEDSKSIDAYIQSGRRMTDVLGLSLEDAEQQLPEDEANDFEWPYNQEER